jgi:hypothetical protein
MRKRIRPNATSLVTEVPKEGIHRNTTEGNPMVAPDHLPQGCVRESVCECCVYEIGCMRKRIRPYATYLVTVVPYEGIHRNTTMGKPMVAPDHHPKGSDRESVCECCVNETDIGRAHIRTQDTSSHQEFPKQLKNRQTTMGEPRGAPAPPISLSLLPHSSIELCACACSSYVLSSELISSSAGTAVWP